MLPSPVTLNSLKGEMDCAAPRIGGVFKDKSDRGPGGCRGLSVHCGWGWVHSAGPVAAAVVAGAAVLAGHDAVGGAEDAVEVGAVGESPVGGDGVHGAAGQGGVRQVAAAAS